MDYEEKKEEYSSSGRKKRIFATKGEVGVFAIFLFLSFFFWYIDAMNDKQEAYIKCPVVFQNVPASIGRITSSSKVYLNMEGTGYSLMKLKMSGRRSPVVVDMNKVRYRQSEEEEKYYITSSNIVKYVSSQFKSVGQLISIKPDTLFFECETDTP